MTPFQPRGDRARWRIIFDLLHVRDVGDVVTYEEIAAAVNLDPVRDRTTISVAAQRAGRESEEKDSRAIEAVPNQGYRIVRPGEQMRLARKQQQKSQKAMQRGHSKVVHVDLAGMEPETRKAFEVVAQAFSMQLDMARRLDIRQRRLEVAVESMQEKHDHTDEELRRLHERLSRLEQMDHRDD